MDSARYILGFAAAVCLVCAVLVSGSAVSLRSLQAENAERERQRNVLFAAGLADPEESLTDEEMAARFASVTPVVVDLETGADLPDADPAQVDPLVEAGVPDTSRPVADNPARVRRVERRSVVYLVEDGSGGLSAVVLPVRGQGLWGVLYGFLALEADLDTVRGLTFYRHKETPGLGGEVDNPAWKALWPGRRVFSAGGEPIIEVARAAAGPVASDPHRVDGLSGATMTSRGVTNLLRFWLAENGFGPYLDRLRADAGAGG